MTFFKVSAFAFGGGYSIISSLGNYLFKYNWLTETEYTQIVTISQMTPGPIAINTATYVGAKVFSQNPFSGALTATVASALPSFITVIIAAKIFDKFSDSKGYIYSMKGIRPAVIGLIASAVIMFGKLAFINDTGNIDLLGIGIFFLCVLLNGKFKLSAIYILLISGFLGVLVF